MSRSILLANRNDFLLTFLFGVYKIKYEFKGEKMKIPIELPSSLL